MEIIPLSEFHKKKTTIMPNKQLLAAVSVVMNSHTTPITESEQRLLD